MQANCYDISTFICQDCGNTIPLPRSKSMRREKGHIKDLWCFYCKKEVKMLEIRNKDFVKSMGGTIYITKRLFR